MNTSEYKKRAFLTGLITPALGLTAMLALVSLPMTGCDVDAEEGDIELPEYEQTDDGNFEMPEVDIEGPDVSIEEEEIEVPVPNIDAAEEGSADVDED